jgi:hypothetical protein
MCYALAEKNIKENELWAEVETTITDGCG